jgi:predicted RNase H-like nuclease (RuvC/YqgF family)
MNKKTTTTTKTTSTKQVNENTAKVERLQGRISELVDEVHALRSAVSELQERHVKLARKVLS